MTFADFVVAIHRILFLCISVYLATQDASDIFSSCTVVAIISAPVLKPSLSLIAERTSRRSPPTSSAPHPVPVSSSPFFPQRVTGLFSVNVPQFFAPRQFVIVRTRTSPIWPRPSGVVQNGYEATWARPFSAEARAVIGVALGSGRKTSATSEMLPSMRADANSRCGSRRSEVGPYES